MPVETAAGRHKNWRRTARFQRVPAPSPKPLRQAAQHGTIWNWVPRDGNRTFLTKVPKKKARHGGVHGALKGVFRAYFRMSSRVMISPRRVRIASRSWSAFVAAGIDPKSFLVSASCSSSVASNAPMFLYSTPR